MNERSSETQRSKVGGFFSVVSKIALYSNSFSMLAGKCVSVSSFGSLSEFHPSRKPKGAADRCLDCDGEI